MNRNIGLRQVVLIGIGCIVIGFTGVTVIRLYEAGSLLVCAVACFGLAVSGLAVLIGALGFGIFRCFTNRKRTEVRHNDL